VTETRYLVPAGADWAVWDDVNGVLGFMTDAQAVENARQNEALPRGGVRPQAPARPHSGAGLGGREQDLGGRPGRPRLAAPCHRRRDLDRSGTMKTTLLLMGRSPRSASVSRRWTRASGPAEAGRASSHLLEAVPRVTPTGEAGVAAAVPEVVRPQIRTIRRKARQMVLG
jgi:hypothetical protein